MSNASLRLIGPVETSPQPRGSEVVIEDLIVSYGSSVVIHDLNVRIEPGEFVAIVGRSGCGKSTLLRAMMGLVPITAGRLQVRRETARFVFQEPRLLPWASVVDNVRVGCARHLSKAEQTARAIEVLGQVGLVEKAKAWPADLSGGQRQRVALARALVSEPELLILDEPLGALDALTRIEMQELLISLQQSQGITAILVTHDVPEATFISDRVFVMSDGRFRHEFAVTCARPRRHGDGSTKDVDTKILATFGLS